MGRRRRLNRRPVSIIACSGGLPAIAILGQRGERLASAGAARLGSARLPRPGPPPPPPPRQAEDEPPAPPQLRRSAAARPRPRRRSSPRSSSRSSSSSRGGRAPCSPAPVPSRRVPSRRGGALCEAAAAALGAWGCRRTSGGGGRRGPCPTSASPMGARRWSGWTRGGPTRPSRRPAGASSAHWITTSWPASWPGTAATWPTPAAPSGTSTSRATGPWTGATSGEPWPPTPCPTSTAGPPGSAPAAPRTRTPTPPRAPGPGSDPPTAPTIPLINTKEPTQQRRFQKTLPVPAQWNKHPRNPARDGIKHRWFIRFKNTISLFFGSVGCVKRGRCRVCKGKEKRTYH